MDRDSNPYVVAYLCQIAKKRVKLQEGACCTITSYEATIDGCVVVAFWSGAKADGLHNWTVRLPAGVKYLALNGMDMSGNLPVSFGSATASLEVLDFTGNNFTGTLPQEWGALPSVRLISISKNPLLLLLDTMASPAWVMPPSGQWSDLGGNVWSRLEMLWVETGKVPATAFSQGWLALDNGTLIPVNGSGSGSLFFPLPGGNVGVPEGHLLRPLDLAFNLSVLSSMDRDSDPYVVADICQRAKKGLDFQGGACCVIRSYEASVDGCVAVRLNSGAEADGLHNWTATLPAGVKALILAKLDLSGSLPVSFGGATASLEVLDLGANKFTGTLPASWAELPALRVLYVQRNTLTGTLPASWAELPALRTVYVDNNTLTGTLPATWSALSRLEDLRLSKDPPKDKSQGIMQGNAFTGTLPSEWSELSNLSMFACANGACAGLSGSIPDSWAGLCNLKYFSLFDPANSTSQLTGRLPWKWMYELSSEWRDEDIESCFPSLVDIPSHVEFPTYVCLARGHPKIKLKSYRRNDGEWAYISNSSASTPQAEAGVFISIFQTGTESLLADLYGLKYDLAVERSACTSTNRFTLIPVVCGAFGFAMLCTLVVLLLPTSLLSRFVAADGSSTDRRSLIVTKLYSAFRIAWFVEHMPVMLKVMKVGSVLFDVGSDVYAAYLVRKTSYVWGFLIVLLAPNVIAALVVHLNLSYLTKQQQQQQQSGSAATSSMAAKPASYPLYQWLYNKGGICLLLLATIFMAPYWLLWEIPMIIAAAVGHIWQMFKGSSSRFAASWLNLGHFLGLLSFVMACTESPFVAVVFTYHYAKGMSYSFPVLLTDLEFVLTVGSALLHIAVESWAVVISIKKGRFKKSIRGMFFEVLNCSTEAEGQSMGVAAGASSVHADVEVELGEAGMRSKNVGAGAGANCNP